MFSLLFNVFVFLSLSGICRTDIQIEIDLCLNKTESDFSKCGDKVSKKWKCVMAFSGDKMYCTSIDRECCAMWDTFDCFGEVVKTKCDKNLFDVINEKQFQTQIKVEQSDRCPQLKYKSNECKKLMEEVQNEADKDVAQNGAALGIKPESKSGLIGAQDAPEGEDTKPRPESRTLLNSAKQTENSIFTFILTSISFIALIYFKLKW